MNEKGPKGQEQDEEQQKQKIKELLEKHGILLDEWGKEKAKTLEHLFKEIKAGETVLKEEDEDLFREVSVVGGRIKAKHEGKSYKLVEEKQVFTDGRERRRDMANSVSEKIIAGEDPDIAILRGIEEELGITGDLVLGPQDIEKKVSESPSYPGLKTRYVLSSYDVEIPPDQFRPEGYQEEQDDKTTYFIWQEMEKEPEGN